jgi:hypothetical protein
MECLTVDKYDYKINWYNSELKTLKNKIIDTRTDNIIKEYLYKPLYLTLNIYPKHLIDVIHKTCIENNNTDVSISEYKKLYQPFKIKIKDDSKYVIKRTYLVNERFRVEEYNTNVLFIIEDVIKEITSMFVNSEQIIKVVKPQLYLRMATLN